MENQSKIIVTTYPNGIKSKTIELQREIFDKFNINSYSKVGFGAGMSSMEFQNLLWIMNGCMPKQVPPEITQKVIENSKGVVNAELVLFMHSNTLPLNVEAIDFMFDQAGAGKIVNFSLYDGIAFSKTTFQKLGMPNMKDLFSVARSHKVPILNLTVGSFNNNGLKTYCYDNKELFCQVSGENYEQNYWERCEELLTRGIYEDRSIKH